MSSASPSKTDKPRPRSPSIGGRVGGTPRRGPKQFKSPTPPRGRESPRRNSDPHASKATPTPERLERGSSKKLPLVASGDALCTGKGRVRGGGNIEDALTHETAARPSVSPPGNSFFKEGYTREGVADREPAYMDVINSMPAMLTDSRSNVKNNIILMTDGYKFSHHKQYPVSWMPEQARPEPSDADHYAPAILFAPHRGLPGAKLLKILPVPCFAEDPARPLKVTVVTNITTAVVDVLPADPDDETDLRWTGLPCWYIGAKKKEIVVHLSPAQREILLMPDGYMRIKFVNIDDSKLKRGSTLNANFEGGYNVSYFTPRAFKEMFEHLDEDKGGDHIVFFGLQYFIKEYLEGVVVTKEKIDAGDAFVARYMSDVRVIPPNHINGFDFTMFPRGDWEAIMTGDHDATGEGVPALAGRLPIKIEALPEGTLVQPGVCCFKLSNTHPRFFWLPNFLETLLVQVWYPTTVATQAREFRKTIQAHSVLSQRVSQMPEFLGPREYTKANLYNGGLAIHISQVFDLLDFGYRGVSSHETAALGSAAYYTTGFEGSDTVAGARMILQNYNAASPEPPVPPLERFSTIFEMLHGATSVPAAEHSTITSWADMSADSDHEAYEKAEYAAFTNMIRQYNSSFCVSLVSDGFNIWNACANLWPSTEEAEGVSMRGLINDRMARGMLTLLRPDSGEGVETLPQMLTILQTAIPEVWQKDCADVVSPFADDPARKVRYEVILDKIRRKVGLGQGVGNPFRRFVGQQFRILQGDGVSLVTVPDMLASLLANGFCASTVHYGSGGGLMQKVNRDSLSCAFKCCSMYVHGVAYNIGKDPIAGGKKSYPGNPAVIRYADGVLRNRGQYENGVLQRAEPMSYEEFREGAEGDQLVTVFENGVVKVDHSWNDIRARVRVTDLDHAVNKALDNLEAKIDFLQQLSTEQTIALRLAEAACGSKWTHKHQSKLASMRERYPQYCAAMDSLGFKPGMDSNQIIDLIKERHMCDKKLKKRIIQALVDGDVPAARAAMGKKLVLSL
ncbi:hypothetical protein AB1Y20_018873 [Prymnesium parvum]|uniref:Nicotinamide phosphoribosyltransferase n=1 Tax=Prymnesium parvum TaxID=97485 RepID=A0AB34JSJ6_PRYPA